MEYNTNVRTQPPSQPGKPTSTATREPRDLPEDTKEKIRFRAYQIYLSRNRESGHDLDHWLEAERELISRN